jgi:hypothetical protein
MGHMECEGVAYEIGSTLCAFLARAGHALGDTFSGILYGDPDCCHAAVVDFMVAAEFEGRRTVYVVCAREHMCDMDVVRHAQRMERVKQVATMRVDSSARWQLQIQAARMRSMFGGGAEFLGVMAAPRMLEDTIKAADAAGMECFTSAGALEYGFR